MTINEKIKYLRQAAQLTQCELAAAAGIKQQHIARIECGDASPRVDTVELIAAPLGYHLDLVPNPVTAVSPLKKAHPEKGQKDA